MFRYRQRACVEAKKRKKENTNKPWKTKDKCGGTGRRFLAWCECKGYAVEEQPRPDCIDKPEHLKGYWCERCRWHEKHQGQLFESPVHDRTRWKSCKSKTKCRKTDRYLSQID